MDIPLEPAIAALLRQGNVFYFVEPSFSSSEPHNFVLLNRQPSRDQPLLFVCGTSQIERHRALFSGHPPETIVVVTPAEYPDFTRDTLFNCNRIVEKSFADLVRRIRETGQIKSRDHIGMPVLNRLRAGVAASRMIAGWMKKGIILTTT